MSQFYTTDNGNGYMKLRSRARQDVLVRGLSKEDIPVLMELLSDPENTRNDLSMANMTPKDVLSLAERWCAFSSPLEHYMMLITVCGRVVGICGFGVIREATGNSDHSQKGDSLDQYGIRPDENRTLYEGILGIVVSQPFRGKGLAREALLMTLAFGFEQLEFAQVVIGTTGKNIAMKRLMESPPPRGLGLQASVVTPDKFGNDLKWLLEKAAWPQWSDANLSTQS